MDIIIGLLWILSGRMLVEISGFIAFEIAAYHGFCRVLNRHLGAKTSVLQAR